MTYVKRKYKEAPLKDYNGFPLYSLRSNTWYRDINEYWEQIEDRLNTTLSYYYVAELKKEWDMAKTTSEGVCNYGLLYLAEPKYLPQLKFDDLVDLPDGCNNLTDILKPDHPIAVKLVELNRLIEEEEFIVSYSESNYKPNPETLTLNSLSKS